MLKIPKTVECALKIYWVIAHADAKWVPGALIIRQCHYKRSTVITILNRLSSHGLLETVRGRRGGYRVPREIKLRQIVEAVCPNQCPHEIRSCNILVRRFERYVMAILNRTVAMPKQDVKQKPADGVPLTGAAVPERTTYAQC